jgi:uncharacterized FAD-dependent dehydrogenase
MKKLVVSITAILFVLSAFSGLALYAGDKGKSKDKMVYVTDGGKKYHKKNCKMVAEGKKGIKKSEAKKMGMEPCKMCYADKYECYANENGKKFHKKDCKMLKEGAMKMSTDEAKKKGLEPCKMCMAKKMKKEMKEKKKM